MAVVAKAGHEAPPPKENKEGWMQNAYENDMGKCYGQVRYGDGASGRWSKIQSFKGEYKCNNDNFGDPAPGKQKSCECKEWKPESSGP
jgi:hypothetical protein